MSGFHSEHFAASSLLVPSPKKGNRETPHELAPEIPPAVSPCCWDPSPALGVIQKITLLLYRMQAPSEKVKGSPQLKNQARKFASLGVADGKAKATQEGNWKMLGSKEERQQSRKDAFLKIPGTLRGSQGIHLLPVWVPGCPQHPNGSMQ